MAAEGAPAVESPPGVVELEQAHVIQNYARYPLVITRGKGVAVYDDKGRRYLDFISGIGVNALGHAHPRIVKVVREQVARLVHCSNLYYHEFQGRLAARLAELSGLPRVFFANSGTEAMEGALKIARAAGIRQDPAKYEIVALENSFHGRTFGALSITGQEKYRKDFEPLLPGARFVPINDVAALEQAISERTCAVVLEPVLGEGGIFFVSREFAERAAELARRYGALLILDEIQCGLGRTGAYFAFQHWNQEHLARPPMQPDLMVLAKPLGCGFPIGAILATESAAAILGPGMHGSTFGGGALICRVALEFLDLLPDLLPAIRENGRYFERRLHGLAEKYRFIKEIRGAGLMLALDLSVPAKPFVLQALDAGFLINSTHETVLRFLPPYVVETKDIIRVVDGLDRIFGRFDVPPESGGSQQAAIPLNP